MKKISVRKPRFIECLVNPATSQLQLLALMEALAARQIPLKIKYQ